MFEYLIVSVAALVAAGLTLYSGFGLGTLLLPFSHFFFQPKWPWWPQPWSHGANNVFKVLLLGRRADAEVVLKFGLPAIVAAILGAMTLGLIAQSGSSMGIEVNDTVVAEITPVKFLIGLLMIGFALFELVPHFRSLQFERRLLPLGGLLSGFFGGLSGHQGALRSAFLAKSGLSTGQFVGSNAVIGFLVDLTRLSVYAALFTAAGGHLNDFGGWSLVFTGAISAFCGVLLGKKFLKKITMASIQTLVGILLFGVGLALLTGIL